MSDTRLMFEGFLTLTAGDLCSCRFCHPVWPSTDQSHPPGPGVLRLNEESRRKKRTMMRQMVMMKTSAGWSCPSPPQRRKEIPKGKETACRHAYTQTGHNEPRETHQQMNISLLHSPSLLNIIAAPLVDLYKKSSHSRSTIRI